MSITPVIDIHEIINIHFYIFFLNSVEIKEKLFYKLNCRLPDAIIGSSKLSILLITNYLT